jgi:hypothetical protein
MNKAKYYLLTAERISAQEAGGRSNGLKKIRISKRGPRFLVSVQPSTFSKNEEMPQAGNSYSWRKLGKPVIFLVRLTTES